MVITIKKRDILRAEVGLFYGDHLFLKGDIMRVEIGLFNGDHHFKKGDIM